MHFSSRNTISITCPKRLTPYLREELENLNFPITTVRLAGIETEGTLHDCMKLNLVLRCAHRIHFLIKDFQAEDADQLYDQLIQIDWENYFEVNGYISITSFIDNRTIRNTQFANLKVKDAIVDRFREKTGSRPDSGSRLDQGVVFLFWQGSRVSVFIDTSGESISRRGYRVENHLAPMQETLAAAAVKSSKWTPNQHFINPMCGSGTLAIEAALMALNKAPGLLRPNFGIKHVKGFDVGEWNGLRTELKYDTLKTLEKRIIATDIDPKAIKAAQKNAQTAGVDHLIEFKCCPFEETEIPEGEGVVIMNPPYGERIGNFEQLEVLYKEIGDFFKQKCSGKWGYVFTGNMDLGKRVGLRPSSKTEFYNTTIDCRLLEFELY